MPHCMRVRTPSPVFYTVAFSAHNRLHDQQVNELCANPAARHYEFLYNGPPFALPQ